MSYEDLSKLLLAGKETVAVRVHNHFLPQKEYAHIELQVAHVAKEGRYDTFGFYDNYYGEKHQYRGLYLSCQLDSSNTHAYGFKIGIKSRAEFVELEEAESMTKVLRTINRKMRKIEEKEGFTDDFSEYAMRFTRAINAKAFYANYNGNRAQAISTSMGDMRSLINSMIATNINQWNQAVA